MRGNILPPRGKHGTRPPVSGTWHSIRLKEQRSLLRCSCTCQKDVIQTGTPQRGSPRGGVVLPSLVWVIGGKISLGQYEEAWGSAFGPHSLDHLRDAD